MTLPPDALDHHFHITQSNDDGDGPATVTFMMDDKQIPWLLSVMQPLTRPTYQQSSKLMTESFKSEVVGWVDPNLYKQRIRFDTLENLYRVLLNIAQKEKTPAALPAHEVISKISSVMDGRPPFPRPHWDSSIKVPLDTRNGQWTVSVPSATNVNVDDHVTETLVRCLAHMANDDLSMSEKIAPSAAAFSDEERLWTDSVLPSVERVLQRLKTIQAIAASVPGMRLPASSGASSIKDDLARMVTYLQSKGLLGADSITQRRAKERLQG